MEILQYLCAGLVFIIGTYALFRNQLIIVYIGFFLTFLGQLARLPIPITEIGILISDLFIPWIVALWLLKELFISRSLPKTSFGKYILLFLLAAVLSLLINSIGLPISELLSSGFYLVRLIAYLLFYFLCFQALQKEENRGKMLMGLYITSVGLAIAGLIQYFLVPDFTFMAQYGWDPHIGRLLSTWYDPNYIAGFFAVIIGILTSIWLMKEKRWLDIYTPITLLLLLVVFALTFSRSGLVALGVVVLCISLLKARSLLIIGLLGLLIAVGVNDRAQERAMGLVNSALSVVTGSLDYDLDATSKLRVESWNQSINLIDGNYLTGIGYNTIQYKKLTKGLITSDSIHSGSGSDSSLLNIFITTGIIGLLLYMLFYAQVLSASIKLYRQKNIPNHVRGFSLGIVSLICALLLHSFFVNSLLLPFFILIMMPLFALLDHYAQIYLTEKH